MDVARAEKLAAARKKLRAFEHRKQNDDSPVPSHSSSHEPLNGRLSALSNASAVNGENSLGSSNGSPSTENGPFTQRPLDLSAALAAKEQECEESRKQLAELHGLYSQLHHAYSQSTQGGSNGVSEDVRAQIVQLQSALAVNVKEKTALQSQLREANSRTEELQLQLSAALERFGGAANERAELKSLEGRLAEAERLLSGRLQELKEARKDAAALQAANRTLQQDLSEAQARLRGVYKEKERMENDLRDLRKELGMKEMHIRQLSAHGNSLAGGVGSDTLQALKEEVCSLRVQLSTAHATEQHAMASLSESEQRHADVIQHITQNYAQLQNEMEEISKANEAFQVKICMLEDELQCSKQELGRFREESAEKQLKEQKGESKEDRETKSTGISEEEVEKRVDETAKRLTLVFEERLLSEGEMYRTSIEEKERELTAREEQITNLVLKYDLLRAKQEEKDAHSEELSEVLQALQNEKATVSRALSQNRELKEQVVELEERLMTLAHEKCQSELARQAAEHAWRLALSSSSPIREAESKNHESDEAAEALMEEREKTERDLREQLHQSTRELEQMRAALHRSHTANEEMNGIMRQNAEDENQNSILVELGQAVARINALVEENEQLRARLMDVERQSDGADEFESKSMKEKETQSYPGEDGEEIRPRKEDATTCTDGNSEEVFASIQVLQNENETLRSITQQLQAELQRRRTVSEMAEKTKERVEEKQEIERDSQDEAKLAVKLRSLEAKNEKLEHVNVQLQLENETIADHVILYQHQRRMIRERLRQRDEQLHAAEQERARIGLRCQELQGALSTLLSQHNIRMPKRADASCSKSRSYSHSTVDEISGDEEVLIDASNQEVPDRELELEEISGSREGQALKRVLEIISDIKSAPAGFEGRMLRCTQCIGDTIIV